MPKIDLLPCPFCGSPAKLCFSKANAAGTRFAFWVHCDFRGDLNCDVIPTTPKFDTAEQAAKAWNTRASGWIPCSKRMPDDDEEVLFAVAYPWDKGRKPKVALGRHYTKNEKGWWAAYYGAFLDYEVTHWMPLPETPELT